MSSYAGRNINSYINYYRNINIINNSWNRMVSQNCKYIIDIRNLFVIRTTEIIFNVSMFTVTKIITKEL